MITSPRHTPQAQGLNRLLTLKEAAKVVGVSHVTLHRHAKYGDLPVATTRPSTRVEMGPLLAWNTRRINGEAKPLKGRPDKQKGKPGAPATVVDHSAPIPAMTLAHTWETHASYGIHCTACDRLVDGNRYVAMLGGPYGCHVADLCSRCWEKAQAQPERAQAILGAYLCPHLAPAEPQTECQCEPNGDPRYGETVTLDQCDRCAGGAQ